MAIAAKTYFRLHRLFAPLIALYRRIHPIPRSPEPNSPEDEASLALVPVERLTKRMAEVLKYLAEELNGSLGNYAEFGVYNGTSLICMHRAMSQVGITQATLHGFDSFQGLPPEVVNEDGGVWRPGQFRCPMAVTTRNLEENGFPHSRLRLIPGWYRDTLREKASADIIGQISIVMIDSDAYSSARLALEFVEPVLTKVAAIVFDDWKLNDLDIKDMGEYRAFREFLSSHPQFRASLWKGYNRKSKIAILRRIEN